MISFLLLAVCLPLSGVFGSYIPREELPSHANFNGGPVRQFQPNNFKQIDQLPQLEENKIQPLEEFLYELLSTPGEVDNDDLLLPQPEDDGPAMYVPRMTMPRNQPMPLAGRFQGDVMPSVLERRQQPREEPQPRGAPMMMNYGLAQEEDQFNRQLRTPVLANTRVTKRSPACIRRCLRLQMLHPAQCNSLC